MALPSPEPSEHSSHHAAVVANSLIRGCIELRKVIQVSTAHLGSSAKSLGRSVTSTFWG